MNVNESVKASGRLNVFLYNEETGEAHEYDFENLVVTVGKNHIAARMKTTGLPAEMSHMAVGTNATAAVVGDTTLGTEIARVALGTAGGTVAANVVTYQGSFPAGTGTGALTEAGIFNAGAAGTLLCRTVFSVINKAAGDSMVVTWTLTIN